MGKITWTENEVKLLIELVNDKKPLKDIEKILNKSYSGIKSKIQRLKIDTSQIYKCNIKFKAIYQDYDWCYQKFIIEGLNHAEMAEEADSSIRVIKKWVKEIYKLTQKYRQETKEPNNLQKEIIIGSLLGYGHIDKREKYPIFIEVHAKNQKDYLYWKYEILKDLCNISPSFKKGGKAIIKGKECNMQPSYRLCTRVYDFLKYYRSLSNHELLDCMTELILSIWILDDASRDDKGYWDLCIAEYSQEDMNFAEEKFNGFNLNGHVQKDKRYYRFDAVSSRKIDKIILRNIPNDLDIIQYKILSNDRSYLDD
jgi:hypothetical protein